MRVRPLIIILVLLVLLWLNILPVIGLDNSKIAQAGIISAQEYAVNVYSQSNEAYIALRTVPYIPPHNLSCFQDLINTYNTTIQNIFSPIQDQITSITSASTLPSSRFAGLVVGAIALGVATSAQITAAVALTKAQQNAQEIIRLRDSIQNTINAVNDITVGLSSIGVALSKVQNYLNDVINPALQNLSCQVSALNLGIQLNLYLTEITTIFGPQITNPSLTPLSIQALYTLAGDNLMQFLTRYGYGETSVSSILESGLISAQIVSFDKQTGIAILYVTLPSIATLSGSRVTKLMSVSVQTGVGEGSAIVPSYVIQQGTVIEEFIPDSCIFTRSDVYCTQLYSKLLPDSILQCLQGSMADCQFTRSLGSFANRFMTVAGGVIANCQTVLCRCYNPVMIIPQNNGIAVTLIDGSLCKELELEGIRLTMADPVFASYSRDLIINGNQFAPSDALDISSELGQLNNSISSATDNLQKAQESLNKSIIPAATSSWLIILLFVLVSISLVIGCISIYFIYKHSTTNRSRNLSSDIISNPYIQKAN
ncbi:fusion protein [avian paramyxovirus 7]|uniref:Fusion glycoprotein F0 n=1 Tax=avian paramyxovirus 7 TaxID=2560317 RepID=C6FGY9_9MONO|nr:fusion protein [Avian metaavulavirus 7]ACN72643.1 fusion protein [Avian metaavulavirus 7]